MSRNISRITLTLVASLLGAAFVYGQNFGQAVPPPAQPPAGGQISAQAQLVQPPAGGGGGSIYVAAPPAAGGIVARSGGADIHWAGSHDADPEVQKLNHEERELARQADDISRRLGDAENTGDRDKLRTELREVLGKQFDIQRERREQEIAQIEERVRKLRDQLKKRTDNRQKIIDNRIDQILNDADGLGWNGPDGGQPGPAVSFFGSGGGGRAITLPAVAPGSGARGIAPAPVPFPPGLPATAPRPGRVPGAGATPSADVAPGAAPAVAR
jgi:hypothetical protein